MKVRLVAVGVASPVHGVEYYARLWQSFQDALKAFDFEVLNVMVKPEDVESAREAVKSADALVIAVLTGGSSRLARLVASKAGKDKPIVLVAHGFHNSMASALSAKSRLEHEGYRVVLVEALTPRELPDIAAPVFRAVKAVAFLRKARVVEFNVERVSGEALEASKKLGFSVDVVKPDEVKKLLETVNPKPVLEYLEAHLDLGGVSKDVLEKPAKLAAAMAKVVSERGYDAVTIDCFPFILEHGYTPCIALSYLLDEGVPAACEADYRALALLMLAKFLTGKPGWMANPSHYDPQTHTLLLAHCTVATTLTIHSTLLPHFETSKPYAVAGRLEPGVYTMAAISPGFDRLAFTLAEVKETGLVTPGRCRTQIVVKLEERDPRPFTVKAVSNHHVLIPGDVRQELRVVAHLLGMKVVEY